MDSGLATLRWRLGMTELMHCARLDASKRFYGIDRLTDRLHLAGDRDGGRGLVVGDDDLVLVAVLDAPLAADERRLGDVLGRKGRQVRAIPCHLADHRVEVGGGDRRERRLAVADLRSALE